MNNETVIQLLVAAGGNGATQRIISELQKEGMAVSAVTADSRQELANFIQQPNWDAIICFEDCKISIPVVSDLVAQSSQNIPVILLTNAEKVIELLPMLDQGIADVVPEEQARRLYVSVQREAANVRLKRELMQREKSQSALEDRHCTILSGSTYPISYIHEGTHLYCNQSYASLFGFESANAITSTPFLNLIQAQDHSLVKTLLAQPPEKEESLAIKVVHRDGTEGDMMLTFTPVEFQKKPCIQMTGRPLMGAAREKPMQAQTDNTLTGNVSSDAQFADQIEEAIRAALGKEIFSPLLIIALNDNVPVNSKEDKAGLNAMINDINRFLRDYLEKSFVLARLDEHVFGLILDSADPDEVAALSALIRSSANKHFSSAVQGPAEQHCTIGNTLINGRERKIEYILGQASRNLKPAQLDRIKLKLLKGKTTTSDEELLEYLMTALTQERFKLLYQPVVHIKGSNHKGYEVLSRMLDDQGMEILPEAFIRVANQKGIGEKVDKAIITMALEALQLTAKTGPLIINVSSNTLMSQTFLPWLSRQFEKRKLSHDLAAFAISELEIHNHPGHAVDFCRGLSNSGLKYVISHFGSTADPFALLAEIKPDLVKLDSSLLKDIVKRSTQRTTVQTLVSNLHGRGILVVAPQVESLATLPILWDAGIDYVQGYCLQAPSHEMNYNFLVEEEITLSAGRI